MEILNDFFPKSLTYLFQAINSAPESEPRVGQAISNLAILKDSVVNYEAALAERDELSDNQYVMENIKKANHAIGKLESILSQLPASENIALDCEVYSEYAEKRILELASTAQEIDSRYQSELE